MLRPKTPVRSLGSGALLTLSAAVIATLTLVPIPGGRSIAGICIVCGELGGTDFISNVLMFSPFGFALAWRGTPLWRAALIGGLFSLSIESAQIGLVTGRDASLGDLVANTFGTCLGWTVGFHRPWWLRRDRDMRRCLAVTAITVASLAVGLALFIPSLPESTYFLQWTIRFPDMSVYGGSVHSTLLGPLDLRGPGPIEQSEDVRDMLFTRPMVVVATAGPAPPSLAPIVSIYDDVQRRIMLLGASRNDLVFQYRTLADDLRLSHVDLRITGAFDAAVKGNTFQLSSEVNRRGYCFEIDGDRECGPGFTVGDTWSFLRSASISVGERSYLGIFWLWAAFLPAGFLAVRPRTLAAAMVTAIVGLSIPPALLGFTLTPVHQLFGAMAGLLSGASIARHARRRGRESPSRASTMMHDRKSGPSGPVVAERHDG